LKSAVDLELKTIQNAVKKPFLPAELLLGLIDLAVDEGTIDE
jgi:hypothetical protein